MFESLKTWIEGLFRPVINVTPTGTSYLKVDPTINDLAILKQRHVTTATATIGAAGDINPVLTVPQTAAPWLVREISVVAAAAVNITQNRIYYVIDGHRIYGYPSVASYPMAQGMGFMGWSRSFSPILYPGDSVGYIGNAGGACTVNMSVVYSEVNI